MTVVGYKEYFYALSKYSVAIISIESNNIQKFLKGLDTTFQLPTAQNGSVKGIISQYSRSCKDD